MHLSKILHILGYLIQKEVYLFLCAAFYGTLAKSADLDQTQRSTTSDQSPHYLFNGNIICNIREKKNNNNKKKKKTTTPLKWQVNSSNLQEWTRTLGIYGLMIPVCRVTVKTSRERAVNIFHVFCPVSKSHNYMRVVNNFMRQFIYCHTS